MSKANSGPTERPVAGSNPDDHAPDKGNRPAAMAIAAGAAIGSAALAAALLYVSRRKDRGPPPSPAQAPETD